MMVMPERGAGHFVLRAMTSPFSLSVLGGSLLAAVVFGIHLGESSIGLIKPIYFQGPAVHPRDRGAAIDESSLPLPARSAYSDLYGWDEGHAALAAECAGCGSVRVHRANYSAEVPYFGSRRELRNAVEQARDELGENFVQPPEPVGPRDQPMLRYAYYPISEDEVVAPPPETARPEEAAVEKPAD